MMEAGRSYFVPFNIDDYTNNGYNFVVFSQFGCEGGIDGPNTATDPTDPNNVVGCQNDGPERVFLSGRQIANEPPVFGAPEPSILGLLSLGLIGIGLARRRV